MSATHAGASRAPPAIPATHAGTTSPYARAKTAGSSERWSPGSATTSVVSVAAPTPAARTTATTTEPAGAKGKSARPAATTAAIRGPRARPGAAGREERERETGTDAGREQRPAGSARRSGAVGHARAQDSAGAEGGQQVGVAGSAEAEPLPKQNEQDGEGAVDRARDKVGPHDG